MLLPPIFSSVDSYDLNFMSFKFGNDIFITFEMTGVSYSWPVDKIHISLQFRPSVIRGPWVGPKLTRVGTVPTFNLNLVLGRPESSTFSEGDRKQLF